MPGVGRTVTARLTTLDGRHIWRLADREQEVADLMEAKSVDGLISQQCDDRRAPADQADISRLRSALTWRNGVERRVRGMSGACQGRCR
jgi:hypothetical protein